MRRSINIFLGVFVGTYMLVPSLVLAIGWGTFVEATIDAPVEFLATLINTLTISIASIGGFYADAAMQISLNITNSAAVQQGFKIALTLANLGFVIAIIVIALATIFRNQTYGIKRALIRLVVMAILVNFSLILTGVVINFADKLTVFFLQESVPNWSETHEFASSIIGAINPQGVFDVRGLKEAGTEDTTASVIVGSILASAFISLFALAIWVMAITLFIRYTMLSILLMAMPLAWLSWIFPSTSSWWKKWWDKFIQWTFYAPAMMFFVYIAMTLAQNPAFQSTTKDLSTGLSTSNALGNILVNSNFLNTVLREVVIIFILFGGFMAAKSMGVGMAGAASNLAQSTGKKIWGATKRGAGRSARRAGGTIFGETLKKYGEKWQQAGANSNAFVRTLAAPVRGIGAQMTRGKENLTSGTFKQYQEKYKNMSEAERINRVAASRGIEQIALLESLKDSKRFGEAIRRIPAEALADEKTFERWGQKDLHKLSKNVSGLSLKEIADSREGLGPFDQATSDKLDKDVIGVAKALDGEKYANFFSPYDENKKIFGMNEEKQKKLQATAARGLLLGGSVGKIQKVLEHDNPEVRNTFVEAMLSSGLTWDDASNKNKAVANWMRGKGRQYFTEEELNKLKIPKMATTAATP